MNKIKFLKFDSVCLIAVYPVTVNLEHNYEMCGGNCRYSVRNRVSTNRLFEAFHSFPSARRQQPHLPMVRRLLNILFENYAKKIRVNLSFVKIVTSSGRFKRTSLHITGLFRDQRPIQLPILRLKESSIYNRRRNIFWRQPDLLN